MVVLVCDAGEKYLDSIYDDDWLRSKGLMSEGADQRLSGLFDAYQESVRLALGSSTPQELGRL
jgi:cystathionine beta-synthase